MSLCKGEGEQWGSAGQQRLLDRSMAGRQPSTARPLHVPIPDQVTGQECRRWGY
jgi:hypothetical protein